MSTPKVRRKNSFRQISFFTLAGVSTAELKSQGQEIVAVQKNPLPELRSTKRGYLFAEFVNWPVDSEGILHFTKRFGGLTAPLKSGEEFSFLISDWRNHQSALRARWDMATYVFDKFGLRQHGVQGLQEVRVDTDESFRCRPDKLEYRAKSLFRFILMEFHSIPWESLRKCRRSDCTAPYFVTPHLGQRYCSDICSRSAQREWKKIWWQKNGVAWRDNQSKKNKSKK